MANSILRTQGSDATANAMQMVQQIQAFRQNYRGDPKQAVMQMVRNGQVSNAQLQQAMQMAQQIQQMFK